jgi:hypothetical protein
MLKGTPLCVQNHIFLIQFSQDFQVLNFLYGIVCIIKSLRTCKISKDFDNIEQCKNINLTL